MKSLVVKVLAIFIALAVAEANAAALSCMGKVNRVLVYRSGDVNVNTSWRNDYTIVCNLNNEWKGVNPKTCNAWLSVLQAASVTGETALFWYSNEENYESCSVIPTYSTPPAPVYIGF